MGALRIVSGSGFGHAAGEFMAWALQRRKRFCVGGRSMLPTLRAGEFVLMNPQGDPGVGSLVVFQHPAEDRLLVKRVKSIEPDGTLIVISDNTEEGIDSREFGPVQAGAVTGVVSLSLERPLSRLDQAVVSAS